MYILQVIICLKVAIGIIVLRKAGRQILEMRDSLVVVVNSNIVKIVGSDSLCSVAMY
jgi:hypothetical protein